MGSESKREEGRGRGSSGWRRGGGGAPSRSSFTGGLVESMKRGEGGSLHLVHHSHVGSRKRGKSGLRLAHHSHVGSRKRGKSGLRLAHHSHVGSGKRGKERPSSRSSFTCRF